MICGTFGSAEDSLTGERHKRAASFCGWDVLPGFDYSGEDLTAADQAFYDLYGSSVAAFMAECEATPNCGGFDYDVDYGDGFPLNINGEN